MLLPSFCQLNSIGGKSDEVIDIAGIKSDEATQVKLASDPDFTFNVPGSWVMVGGPEERYIRVLKSVYKLCTLNSPAIVIVAGQLMSSRYLKKLKALHVYFPACESCILLMVKVECPLPVVMVTPALPATSQPSFNH